MGATPDPLRRNHHSAIDASLVRQLIAAQFPEWAHLPIAPVDCDGWDNRTFRLGADMSVRLPSAECYSAQVKKEQRWLPLLAPHLPLPIPLPLAMGAPGSGYRWRWSVYRWIEGTPATREGVEDLEEFAVSLAQFLIALQGVDVDDAPRPGQHNFFRGGLLSTYDDETRETVAALDAKIAGKAVTRVWERALESTWNSPRVWVHGDISPGNLLVHEGRLSAVIDFGCCAVGDPACDVALAWTFFCDTSREAFRKSLAVDDATWSRGGGWALWKALITLRKYADEDSEEAARASRVIAAIVKDFY